MSCYFLYCLLLGMQVALFLVGDLPESVKAT